jgi:ribonuclease Z
MRFELTILGSGSALPTTNRNTTAQVLNVLERFFLIDCGEATQLQLRKYGFAINRINHNFSPWLMMIQRLFLKIKL